MNIQADQIERIKELGYTEAEARFIYHSRDPLRLLHAAAVPQFHAGQAR